MTSYRYAVTAKARETNDNRVSACTILAIASMDEECDSECMTRRESDFIFMAFIQLRDGPKHDSRVWKQ